MIDKTKNNSSEKSQWPQSLASLNVRQFRWLLISNTLFFLVMQGQFLTRTYLAWELTHEKMAIANVNLAVAIPMLFAAIVGGAISDRVERRRLIIGGQVILLLNECYVPVYKVAPWDESGRTSPHTHGMIVAAPVLVSAAQLLRSRGNMGNNIFQR